MVYTPGRSIEDWLSDFLGSAPTLEELAAYRFPDELQDRAQELLHKNRSGSLTDEERDEMEHFAQVEHLIILIKAKARLNLKKQSL